jgi:hypothetical protein
MSSPVPLGPQSIFCLMACLWSVAATAQVLPFDPYAEFQEAPPPVLPDGTLHWGTFFKSQSLEQSYRRLWSLGACRGTNKAITIPVERNKVIVDRLPEAEYQGFVRQAMGGNAGGVIAFSEQAGDPASAPVFFAQLHPAGVTTVVVTGPTSVRSLTAGMTVRLRTTVDERGEATEPAKQIEVITLPPDFEPDAVRPGQRDTIVGRIFRVWPGAMLMHVAAGRVRRVTVPLGDETEVVVDASELDRIEPGDAIDVKGRLWTGEGSVGAGTIFVSKVTVTKHGPGRDPEGFAAVEAERP